uniref:StAR related lipid transfer domain containing 6 n=1 Tax=Papio anubis TaxID=9555 RepID=A0A8I5MUI8_PAPAN
MGQPSKRHRPSRPNSPLRPQNKNKTKQKKPHTSTALRRKLRPVTQRETPQSIPNPDTAPPQGSPHSQLTQPSQQSSTPALAFKPPQHGAGLRCARAAVGRRALGQARKRPERRRGCCGALGRDPCWELIRCSITRYRVEGIIPESAAKLSDFLYQTGERVTWDKSLQVYDMVHRIDSDTFICHTITQSFAMGSISPRDFIDLVYIKRYEGNMNIISSKSVDFPEYPPSSNYIRGYNHPCGFVCSPMKENPAYSKLVMFVQTEMRGKLSPSIIEKTMPSNLVNFILNAKDGIKAHKTPSGRGFRHNSHS